MFATTYLKKCSLIFFSADPSVSSLSGTVFWHASEGLCSCRGELKSDLLHADWLRFCWESSQFFHSTLSQSEVSNVSNVQCDWPLWCQCFLRQDFPAGIAAACVMFTSVKLLCVYSISVASASVFIVWNINVAVTLLGWWYTGQLFQQVCAVSSLCSHAFLKHFWT